MSEAIFKATYVNFKPITTRKVVQITLEIPIEHGNSVIGMLGMPDPSSSQWVAVALLNEEIPAKHDASFNAGGIPSPKFAPEETPISSGRKWGDKPYSQRAGALCSFPEFWKFIEVLTKKEVLINNEDDAKDWLRGRCEVTSRSEIIQNSPAALKFEDIEGQYSTWLKYERNR